jgi:hypothetical protein
MTEIELDELFERAVGVRAGALTVSSAANEIVARHGTNASSARRVLDNVRHMFEGEVFKSRLSNHDLDALLRIFRDRHPLNLPQALDALRQHIEYYEGISSTHMPSARAALERFGGDSSNVSEPVFDSATRLARVVKAIEDDAPTHAFGVFQATRARLKGLQRTHKRIFRVPEGKDYVFHIGGRGELQFNLGLEGERTARYGVAFSFEPSASMHEIEPILPSVRRFNDYFRAHPGSYADLTMFFYDLDRVVSIRSPGPIPPQTVELRSGNFIFLGKKLSLDELDIEDVLDTFDRLLPLYIEVEGGQVESLTTPPGDTPSSGSDFELRPGCPPAPARTTATRSEAVLDVNLRHRILQEALVAQLQRELGSDRAGAEQGPGGVRIDVLARSDIGWRYYEIKTGGSARACIREALGQLLEYAYWGGREPVVQLIVAGEPELDSEAAHYLERLRARFNLPIAYHQIRVDE